MATGIVGVASKTVGLRLLPEALFFVAILGFMCLSSLTVFRMLRFPRELVDDFRLFSRSPGFFTAVAALGVVGSFAIRLYEGYGLARVCWSIGAVLWVVMIYAFAICMMTSREKPPIENAVNGSWLVLVVSTQSLSVLGSLLSGHSPEWIFFISACLFMVGCALYLLLISLLSLRLLFRTLEPTTLTPTYWIVMGAAAISALAGVELNVHAQQWNLQLQALPVLQGFTLFFWIAATGWMPLLVLLGIWRHIIRKHTFRYEPQLWSVVFPVGMYSVATYSLAIEFELGFLMPIFKVFVGLALFAWFATSLGMAREWLFAWNRAASESVEYGPADAS